MDDKDYNKHIDSWSSSKVGAGISGRIKFGKHMSSLQSGHFGYSENDNVTYVERRAILTRHHVLFVIDSLKSNKNSKLTSNFILRKPSIRRSNGKHRYLDDSFSMLFHNLKDSKESLKKVFISPQYNSREETKALQYSTRGKAVMNITAITPGHILDFESIDVYDDSDNLYPNETVECYKYQDGERSYYLLIQHKEPNELRRIYCVEGKLFYGRLIYFEKEHHEIFNYEKLY